MGGVSCKSCSWRLVGAGFGLAGMDEGGGRKQHLFFSILVSPIPLGYSTIITV